MSKSSRAQVTTITFASADVVPKDYSRGGGRSVEASALLERNEHPASAGEEAWSIGDARFLQASRESESEGQDCVENPVPISRDFSVWERDNAPADEEYQQDSNATSTETGPTNWCAMTTHNTASKRS